MTVSSYGFYFTIMNSYHMSLSGLVEVSTQLSRSALLPVFVLRRSRLELNNTEFLQPLLIYKISSMSDLNLASIQASLGVSLEGFVKIREIVQKEAEETGLGKKTSGPNQTRKELDNRA